MFEQTKALCQKFLDMGIPGLDLVVYKDGACVLRHMAGYADLLGEKVQIPNVVLNYDPSITY